MMASDWNAIQGRSIRAMRRISERSIQFKLGGRDRDATLTIVIHQDGDRCELACYVESDEWEFSE